jgi:hypothetical protein
VNSFENEVAELFTGADEHAKCDELLAKVERLETAEILCLWLVANCLIFSADEEPFKATARIEKAAIIALCSRVAPDELDEALTIYYDGGGDEMLERLTA